MIAFIRYLSLILLLAASLYSEAHQLSGTVTNTQGNPVPFASIYVDNTTYGVASNLKGDYFLELQNGRYDITFRSIGYVEYHASVTILNNNLRLDIVLASKNVTLEEITISEDKKDMTLEIIKKTIKKRKVYQDALRGYKCETYIKASLEKEYVDKKDSIAHSLKREKLNFIESYGYAYFQHPNRVKEIKNAYRDLAEKKNAMVTVGISINDDEHGPNQLMEHNPYLFFVNVSDGNFDFNRNMLNIPKLGETPFISPIAALAPLSYHYELEGSFFEDGRQINKIKVTPRNSEGALFSGHLYIIEDLWVIKAVDLTLRGRNLHFYKNFRIIQNYKEFPHDAWVIQRQEFFYDAKEGRKRLIGNTVAVHSNHEINPDYPKNFFNNELRCIEDDAYSRDSLFWSNMRPITLKKEELDYIHKQDSIVHYESSEPYLLEQDSIFNQITFWDVIINGVGHRNTFKGIEYYFQSLLSSVRPFSVGGYHHALGGHISKEWSKANKFKGVYEVDYGFLNSNVTAFFRPSYTYLPKKFGKVYLKGGNVFSMINSYESIAATFSRGNYVEKTFYGIGHEIEITNGLFLDIETEYAHRKPINDLTLSQWSDDLFGDSLNTPLTFDPYKEVLFHVRLKFTPEQKYFTEPYKKIIVGSKYPTFSLDYKKGLNGIFKSDVDYDYLQLRISDDMKLGTMGLSKVNVYLGSFIQEKDIRLTNQKFFRGSDLFFYSNPLKSFQLLGPTIPTKNNFIQAHFIHHFNGALLNKVPLLKRLRLKTVGGVGILLLDDIATLDNQNFRHGEAYVGIEKEFVLWRQLMKIGGYYVGADSNHSEISATFKFGIDFFNSFTNSWSY